MMNYRTRTFYTAKQKSEMWDRWQRVESMSSIGRHFNRASSSIFPHLAQFGGIRPPERKRSRCALSLIEREEISRGLVAKRSLRSIAQSLNRSPSTISREVRENRDVATVCDKRSFIRAEAGFNFRIHRSPNLGTLNGHHRMPGFLALGARRCRCYV